METQTEYVDIESGEMVHLLSLGKRMVTRYLYPGGYLTMSVTNITRLIRAGLPKDGTNLALLVAAKAVAVTGMCHCSNAQYAEELGVSANRVSRMMTLLAKKGFVYRMNPRLVIANPGWCFKGSPEQQQAALETWAALHPIGIVVQQERKTA